MTDRPAASNDAARRLCTAALTKWKLEQGKYPGFIRRTALETPEERKRHEHPDEEL